MPAYKCNQHPVSSSKLCHYRNYDFIWFIACMIQQFVVYTLFSFLLFRPTLNCFICCAGAGFAVLEAFQFSGLRPFRGRADLQLERWGEGPYTILKFSSYFKDWLRFHQSASSQVWDVRGSWQHTVSARGPWAVEWGPWTRISTKKVNLQNCLVLAISLFLLLRFYCLKFNFSYSADSENNGQCYY